MINIFRFLFGRFFIITLLVLLQVAAFVVFIFYLDIITPYYYFLQLAFSLVGIFIVLVLIGRNINPNYIIPWIIILLLLPVPGVVIYLMFSQNRLSRKEKKLYRKLHDCIFNSINQSQATEDSLKKSDGSMLGQSRYLSAASKLPVYDNTYAKYYPTGERFFAALKEELKKAEKFIFMEYFIIHEGMMFNSVLDILKEKINKGVEVRFMYDDIGSIKTVKSGYYRKLRKMGIKCVKFNKYLPVISAVHNNRDHRKITVIDGKTAFIGGANLADEYINVIEKYGYWKDSAIMLKGKAVKSITAMFLHMFNAQSRLTEDVRKYLNISTDFNDGLNVESLNDLDKKDNLNSDILSGDSDILSGDIVCASQSDGYKGFVQPFGDGPMPLYLDKVGQTAIQNMINQAQNYIYLSTPYLIMDFTLTEAIKCAAKRGVDVRIITPHIADNRLIFLMTRSSYRSLLDAGVRIFEYLPGFMHAKNFIADDKVAIVGTMNMDYRSFVHHFECGVWMYDTPCISEIKYDFSVCLSDSKEITPSDCKLNPFQKIIRLVLEVFAPLL